MAKTPEAKVLGVGGSPRKNGNSDVLLSRILKGVGGAGLAAHAVQLRQYQYQGCIGCEKCREDKICTGLKDGMTLMYPDVFESKGLVLASPTHNYNITAWMKAFIDRLYCFYEFDDHRPRGHSSRLAGQGRKAVLAAVCEQVDKADMGFTIPAMRAPLEAMGYEIIGELPVYGIFDRGKVAQEEGVLAEAERLGAALAKSLAG
ncbi:MAG: flavodoxin family protein [Desulfosalsimonadaceae bacterium]